MGDDQAFPGGGFQTRPDEGGCACLNAADSKAVYDVSMDNARRTASPNVLPLAWTARKELAQRLLSMLLAPVMAATLSATPAHAAPRGPDAVEPVARGAQAHGAQARGRIACRITENAGAASGTLTIRRDGNAVSTGTCGAPVAVPAGSYEVVLGLDGAIDRPEKTMEVTVAPGATGTAAADFQTAILEVRIDAGGRRAAGMATIFRNGERVGTLGSGVSGHLSSGTYDIVAKYRNSEQRFDAVTLAPGERRSLAASF